MKLNFTKPTVTITNKDFKKGDIAEGEFSITLNILSVRENMEYFEKYDMEGERANIVAIDYMKSIFIDTVISWDKFENANGEKMECNSENKEILFENSTEFCQKIVEKSMSKATINKKK